MKAAVVRTHGSIGVEEVPDLSLGDYDALVRIICCGICNGTDLKLIDGCFPPFDKPPFILGHEAVGEVVQVGPRVRHYRVGDRVLRPTARYDGGDLNFAWGGFSQFGKVTDFRAISQDTPSAPLDYWWTQQRPIPADLSPQHAAMLITFMEVWSWLRAFDVSPNTSVAIWGLGPVGLAMAECCKVMGAPLVIGIDASDASVNRAESFAVDLALNPTNTDLAARIKAATNGQGADRIVEAVGKRSLVSLSESFVAMGGRIGVYGIEPHHGAPPAPYQLAGSAYYSLHFFGPNEVEAQDEVIAHYRAGRIDPAKFITAQPPLAEISAAVTDIRHKKSLKTIINIA
jgi:threonine dehydrogenase-like Zn-dependent dehydrogenase